MIITPKTGYEHTVEAVNLQDDMVMIVMDGQPGLAHIERYIYPTGDAVMTKIAAIMGAECFAIYRIGEREFAIPLGSNMGEQLPGKVIQPDGEEQSW